MATLPTEIADPEVVLALDPSELARTLLKLAKQSLQNRIFLPASITGPDALCPIDPGRSRYARTNQYELQIAAGEAWHWLDLNLLMMPDPGVNGQNGYKVVTRRGWAIEDDEGFERFRNAGVVPKSLLHPAIADDVWLDLARGRYADAVFRAFRTVEEAVRAAGGFSDDDLGEKLVRRAFDVQNGPLTKASDPEGERLSLAHLFAGALGSYKNPHSHRTVAINDPIEAQEMVILASHLLRIVDTRNAARPEMAGG